MASVSEPGSATVNDPTLPLPVTVAVAEADQKPTVESAAGAGRGNPLTKEFGDFVKKTMEHWKVPGVSIGVIDGDEIYTEGYGFATLPDVPATSETIWYSASTSKAQAAAVLAHLIDTKEYPALSEGWSTKVSSILRDDFVLQDEWATNHITLDDIAGHRTGMGDHALASMRKLDGKQVTPKDVVRSMRNLKMVAEPRVAFNYCNIMYVTLGHVIETVTGKWLGDVLKDLLWAPLGMKSSYFDIKDAVNAPEHFAAGYYWDEKTKEHVNVPYMDITDVAAAGGILSNAVDYSKWVKCLIDEAAPFSKDAHRDIRTGRFLAVPQPSGGHDLRMYGLGWVRSTYKNHVMYAHSGGMHAYGSQVYWLPEEKFGVVAFGNTAVTSNAVEEILGYKLINDRLGIPEEDRFDWNGRYTQFLDKTVEDQANAVKITYPNRPDPPLPPTLTTKDLVGDYHDPGYGTMTLREEPHPDKPDEKILVADRPDTTFKYRFNIHHASGNYWVVYVEVMENPTLMRSFMPGEFKAGSDGKVTELEIEWSYGVNEGKTSFKKIEEKPKTS